MYGIDEELCKKCVCHDCNIVMQIAVNGQPVSGRCRVCCADCRRDGQLIVVQCMNKK